MKCKYVTYRLAVFRRYLWLFTGLEKDFRFQDTLHCCEKKNSFQFSFGLVQTHSTCFGPANQLLQSIVANNNFSLLTTSYFKVILIVIVTSHGAYCNHHYAIIWLYFSSGVHFIISECLLFNPPSAQGHIIVKYWIEGTFYWPKKSKKGTEYEPWNSGRR